MVPIVAAFPRSVDRDHDGDAVTIHQGLRDRLGQVASLGRIEFGGQCDEEFPRDPRVRARLRRLRGAPNFGRIASPFRGTGGRTHRYRNDTGTLSVIVHKSGALVLDARAGTVCGGGGRGVPLAAAEHFQIDVENRHAAPRSFAALHCTVRDGPGCARRHVSDVVRTRRAGSVRSAPARRAARAPGSGATPQRIRRPKAAGKPEVCVDALLLRFPLEHWLSGRRGCGLRIASHRRRESMRMQRLLLSRSCGPSNFCLDGRCGTP